MVGINNSELGFFTAMNSTWTQEPPAGGEQGQSSSIQILASRLLQYRFGMAIHTYFLPVVVLLGVIGNTLSLAVMLRRHNRRISCCLYMAALACTDNLFLICGGYYWMNTDGYPRPMATGECNFIVYSSHIAAIFGVLTIVTMTVDRFLAVRFPLQASSLCSPKRARITIVCLLMFAAIYNTPYLLSTKALSNGRVCAALRSKDTFTQAYSWLSICLNSAIPFTVLLILNMFIIKTIRGRHKYFKDHSSQKEEKKSDIPGQNGTQTGSTKNAKPAGDAKSKEDKAREKQLTVMLMLVTFALLLFTLPQYVRYTVYLLIDNNTSAVRYANYILAYQVSNKLFYTNHAANFFMYCLGGSKFRQDVVNILTCGQYGQPAGGGGSSSRQSASSQI